MIVEGIGTRREAPCSSRRSWRSFWSRLKGSRLCLRDITARAESDGPPGRIVCR